MKNENIDYNDLKIIKIIGKTKKSIVNKVYHNKLEKFLALKEYTINDFNEKEIFLKEINIMKELGDHKNIIKYFGITKIKDNKYGLLTEYFDGDTLSKFLENIILNWQEKYDIIFQICSTILFFYNNDYIHRDIKNENILINSKYEIKFIDFESILFLNKKV
jgi:serine/threonine protein kinase